MTQEGMSAVIAASIQSTTNKISLKADNTKAESGPHKRTVPNTASHKAEVKGQDEEGKLDNSNDHSQRPRPKNPASIAYEKKMGEIDGRIATIKRKMDTLRGDYSGSAGGDPNAPAAVRAEREKLMHRVREIRDQQRKISEDRKQVAKDFSETRELLRKKGAEVTSQKDKLPYKSAADIDRLIAEYEKQLETNAFKLAEERQILQEVSKLRKAKKALQSLDGSGSDMGSLRLRMDSLKSKLQERDNMFEALKAQQDAISEELGKLDGVRAEHQAKGADRQKQLDSLKKDLDKEYDNRRKAYAEHKESRRLAQAAAIKAQAHRQEYQRRQEIEKEIDQLESKLSRLSSDSVADRRWNECTNLSAFFSTFLPKTTEDKPSESQPTRKPGMPSSDEFEVLKSKYERDEEFSFMGLKAIQPKSKGKKVTGSKQSPNQDLSRLPISILAALADMSLSPPSDLAGVGTLLKLLGERKSALQSDRASSQAILAVKQEQIVDQINELKAKLEEPVKVNVTAIRREQEQQRTEQQSQEESPVIAGN